MHPTDLFDFTEEYERLTAIDVDDWSPDDDEDWNHLMQSSIHMLYEIIQGGF